MCQNAPIKMSSYLASGGIPYADKDAGVETHSVIATLKASEAT